MKWNVLSAIFDVNILSHLVFIHQRTECNTLTESIGVSFRGGGGGFLLSHLTKQKRSNTRQMSVTDITAWDLKYRPFHMYTYILAKNIYKTYSKLSTIHTILTKKETFWSKLRKLLFEIGLWKIISDTKHSVHDLFISLQIFAFILTSCLGINEIAQWMFLLSSTYWELISYFI